MKALRLVSFVAIALLTASTVLPQSDGDVRKAIDRALPLFQKSATTFTSNRSCVSCHHNVLPVLTLRLLRTRDFGIDDGALRGIEDRTFHVLRGPDALDEAVQGANLSDPTPNDSYLLMAAEAAGFSPDPVTSIYARRMANWQRDGHWTTSDFRPPHSSSLFTATATAVKALRRYMPSTLAAERDSAIVRASRWMAATKPASTEDAAFRLMGLVWAAAPRQDIDAAARDLLSLQRKDGGWSETPNYDSDAYSTGESLFALHEAGAGGPGIRQRAVKFLLSTQAQNGMWRVRTRMVSPAEVSPPYFSTGLPYGKDEFLSYAGTCWALMALAAELPGRSVSFSEPAASGIGNWETTISSGSVRDVDGLLTGGFDPNSKTSGGVTALMMAAPDVEKVGVLLARGADAKARTEDGVDALTVAATYRGTAASIAALFDAGARPEPPEGVHVRRAPLVFAAMSGDVENVKLLLARGAKPSAEALAEAVTFGNTEVVKVLLAGGADAKGTESSGINLIHWAVITGRTGAIPLLAAAGVPINAQDQFGFTPLTYAAMLDTGPRDLIPVLLKAGAARSLENKDKRTPMKEALRFKRSEAIEALK